MSTSALLETLRKHDLEQYYTNFHSRGMLKLESLAELSMQDYTKLGVRSIDDKRRFMALAQDLKQRRARQQHPSPLRAVAIKRPLPSRDVAQDRKARRMTFAPQTIPRATPPKTPTANRRLSFLPRRDFPLHRSPIQSTSSKARVSPSVLVTPPKPPKFMEEFNPPSSAKESLAIQQQSRHLNAYGIPVTPPKRPTNAEYTHNQTLEDYILSKSAPKAAPTYPASDLQQRIRVCVRKRPLSKKEKANGERDIAPVSGARTLQVNAPKSRVDLTKFTEQHSFTFDEAFDCSATNEQIYYRTARPLVDYMFAGGKATCFAYGQTGSGKTFTMLDPQNGLYRLAANDIFKDPRFQGLNAWVGFYEIYQGQLYDLLNQRKRLIPREDRNNNVVIAGLKECAISSVSQLMEVFDFGSQSRTTGKTGANSNSSRSHAVLQVVLRPINRDSEVVGKLSFIDLAGSERGADRGEANMKTRLEGAEINKSLLALKECIRALDQDKKHTPFRGSKLTQVLRDSFVGNSRTCMIATISPNMSNSEHTLNTLRYADRVKELKGESDPRLMGDIQPCEIERTISQELTEMGLQEERPMDKDESQSVATSDVLWEEDNAENIMDVDFPSQASATALGTPRNNRVRQMSPTTPHRQENYMRRLSSPPEEVFQRSIDDPFESAPLRIQESLEAAVDRSVKQEAPKSSDQPVQVSAEHIKGFIKLHRAQIKELEDCIKHEKKMIAKLTLAVSSYHDFQDEGEVDNGKSTEEFEDYLNDLEDVLERKMACVETLKDRVKSELGDEEEDNM